MMSCPTRSEAAFAHVNCSAQEGIRLAVALDRLPLVQTRTAIRTDGMRYISLVNSIKRELHVMFSGRSWERDRTI